MKTSTIKNFIQGHEILGNMSIKDKFTPDAIEFLADIMSVFEDKLLKVLNSKDKLQKLLEEFKTYNSLNQNMLSVDNLNAGFMTEIEAVKLEIARESLKDKSKMVCTKLGEQIQYKFNFKDFKNYCATNNVKLIPVPSYVKTNVKHLEYSERKVVKNNKVYLVPILCKTNIDPISYIEYTYSKIMTSVLSTILDINLENMNVVEIKEKYSRAYIILSIYANTDLFKLLGLKINLVEEADYLKINSDLSVINLFNKMKNIGYDVSDEYINEVKQKNLSEEQKSDYMRNCFTVLTFDYGKSRAYKLLSSVSNKMAKSPRQMTPRQMSPVRSPSRSCKYGPRKSGSCKKKPGPKSPKKCSYGVRKSGSCKKKSGRKSPKKCSYGVRKSGSCKKKSGRKSRK